MAAVTCPTCHQDIAFERVTERGVFVGRVRERCACGTRELTRRLPGPREQPQPRRSFERLNGYMHNGRWHGTCINPTCGAAFVCNHPRKTCNAKPCRLWAKNRHERRVELTCPNCGQPYLTRAARPRVNCRRTRCRPAVIRARAARRANND